MKRRKASKNESIKHWKKGINNVKNINTQTTTGMRGGIRL